MIFHWPRVETPSRLAVALRRGAHRRFQATPWRWRARGHTGMDRGDDLPARPPALWMGWPAGSGKRL